MKNRQHQATKEREYAEDSEFFSLDKRLPRQICDIVADAAQAITNGAKNTFGSDTIIRMSYFHVVVVL